MAYTLEQYAKGEKLTAEALSNAENRTVPFVNDVLNALGAKIRVSSTVRDAAHNKAVKGAVNSKHLTTRALAVDFVPVRWEVSITEVVKTIARRHGFGYLEHDKGSGQHIHCEYRGSGKPPKKTLNQV